ncbi:MAG: ribosome small subunit-dependent GTPase A [Bacteroidetes bacterium 4572_128]|nr:MAG: ribosome small subunit-dependent GTPase A [Bacteroidetes bacterium 4572_128]
MLKKKALVIKSTGSWYTVKYEDKIINCRIRGKFRLKGIRNTNPIAVGDIVDFQILKEENIGLIKKIHERKNYIIRRSVNLSKRTQIIASNIDIAFLLITIEFPKTKTIFIDRFLATAEAYKIPIKLIFNKIDLFNEENLEKLKRLKKIYENLSYECFETSAEKNIGISKIRDLIKNKISLFSGNSGVGKSTLINKIDKNLSLKTDEISNYHKKGKHTTTFAEMFFLEMGGAIIDTPGIKSFGTFDMKKEEISHFFPEIFYYSRNCKYHNCMHINEPNCEVKNAVKKGEINISRYKSYINILQSDENEKYRTSIYEK